jgi:uncharacterized membrane protein
MRKVWIATSIYAAIFIVLALVRWHIWSYGSDTGTFAQAVRDAFGGFRNGPEGGSHFRFHFSPIIGLLFPIVAATRSALPLQIAQVVLVALTAPALYALFRPSLDDAVAYRLAVVALLYPPLASIAFGEFHEVAFFPVLAILLALCAVRGAWRWFFIVALASLLVREDICIELSAIGFGLAIFMLATRRRLEGAAFAFVGCGAALVAFAYYRYVDSIYGGWPHSHFYTYTFATGPMGTVVALFTQPAVAWPAVASFGRLTYLLEAFVPLVFLPLRSWWTLLALPAFGVVLLAAEQSVWRMGNHYAAMWAPWLLVGTGAALVGIQQRSGAAAARRWANGAIAACVLFLVVDDPMHPAHYLAPPYGDLASARSALACVPPDASLSTHDEWFAHIAAADPNATIQRADGVDWLVYADDFPNQDFQTSMRPRLEADVASGRYRVACTFGRVKAYEKNEQGSIRGSTPTSPMEVSTLESTPW